MNLEKHLVYLGSKYRADMRSEQLISEKKED